jgi:hypothetical protein
MSAWLDFVFWTVLWVLTVGWLFEGVRRLTIDRPHRKAVAIVLWNASVCIVFGAAFLFFHLSSARTLALLTQDHFAQLPATWGADLQPEAREKASVSYAQTAFLGAGKLLNYVDRSGEWKRFVPTQEQMRERESAVRTQVRLEEVTHELLQTAVSWWLSGALAALFGWLFGRSRPKLPANRTIDTDRRACARR